jgi:transposase
VAVLGASNFTYAEATRSQALPDWLGSHVRAFVNDHHYGAIPGSG